MKHNLMTMLIIYLIVIVFGQNTFLRRKETNQNTSAFEGPNLKAIKLENVEIRSNDYTKNGMQIPKYANKLETPQYANKLLITEYARPSEKPDMKSALIVNAEKEQNMRSGFERPNFLSPVIRSFSTNVRTPSRMHSNIEGSPIYDLDAISKINIINLEKKHYFELMTRSNFDPNLINFIGDNYEENGKKVPVSNMQMNGMQMNGMHVNGIQTNTMPMNNMQMNGMHVNEMQTNTMLMNNMQMNGMQTNTMPMNTMQMRNMDMNNLQMNSMPTNTLPPNNILMNKISFNNMPNQLPPVANQIQMPSQMLMSSPMQIPYNQMQPIIPQRAISLPAPSPLYVPQPMTIIHSNPNAGTPLPPITQSLINMTSNPPMTTKHTVTQSMEHNFNLDINIKGQQVQAEQNATPTITDLLILEEKVKQIDKLSDEELNEVIGQLKTFELHLEKSNDEIYKNIKKYEAQNNVILDSLKDDISDARNQLGGMIVEVPQDQRRIINREIEEEFSKSLAGYTINKAKYANLKDVDPKELYDISGRIKKELDSNDNFYLHGDYNFYI